MSDVSFHILVLINRYLHVVCATTLVGGTLFYEMVVPVAIDELKPEQQLLVFARARWVFKWIVWVSAIILILSGIVSSYRNLRFYMEGDQQMIPRVPFAAPAETNVMPQSVWLRAGWWWAAHASTGVLAVFIAVFLTISSRPPANPIPWMRLNLIILLIVIFLGSATRNVRRLNEQAAQGVYIGSFAPD